MHACCFVTVPGPTFFLLYNYSLIAAGLVICGLDSRLVDNTLELIMPRCACASEVYGSVFVCLCM